MADYNQVVDDIRGFLAAADQTRSDGLRDLAAAYSQLCREANERLRRCGDYLRRGMRSEAIHLAETFPPLLDVVAALDMPELEEWEQLCAMYELPRPVRVQIETAQELNQAYALEQPVQTLLAQHRILAISRAPLSHRLRVMRALAEHEPTSPWWDDDVRLFEAARMKEVRSEAASAVRDRNGERISALLAELTVARWRDEVPQDLVGMLEQSSVALRQEGALAALRLMLPELETAYSAMDFDETSALLARWDTVAAADSTPLPAELAERVEPVRDWHTEEMNRRQVERQFKAACGELEAAADRDAPAADLQAKFARCEAFEMPLPADLAHRYRTLVASRDTARRRRARRNAVLALLGLICLATGTFVLVRRAVHARQAERWAKSVAAEIDAGRLDKAGEVWQAMAAEAPHLGQHAALAATKTRLENAMADDAHRRTEFISRIEAARKTESGDAPLHLDAAEKLAATSSEKLEVLGLRQAAANRRRELQSKTDASFRENVQALADAVVAAEKQLLAGDASAALKLLTVAESRAAGLEGDGAASASAKQGLAQVVGRLRDMRGRCDRAASEGAELRHVLTASPATLAGALKTYAGKFPDSPRGAAFARAADGEPAWLAATEWGRLVAGWRGEFVPANVGDLEKRSAALEKYAASYPASPFLPVVEEYRAYLKQAAVAVDGDGPWRGGFFGTITSPLVRLNQVVVPGGKRYYTVGDGEVREGSLRTVSVILTNDPEKTQRITVRDAGPITVSPSPQKQLSAKLERQIQGLSLSNWESFGLVVLDQVRAQEGLDPLLAAILCGRILRFAETGGWGLGTEVRRAADELASLGAEDAPWMDPENASTDGLRTRAAPLVASATATMELRRKVASKRDAMFRAMAFRTVGTGVLLRQGDQWQIHSAVQPGDGTVATAFAVGKGVAGSARVTVAVGRQGKWDLQQAVGTTLPEGTPVFVEPSARSAGRTGSPVGGPARASAESASGAK